ncbi:MAG: hypothetical protein IT158_24050 [Bryobacterales bacterium]|nr:hypothetical protein [Bryobacterales bacterium]
MSEELNATTKPEPTPEAPKTFTPQPKMTEEQEAAEYDRLLGDVVCRLTELRLHDLREVENFVDIVEHETGCNTPAEEFITDLVRYHCCRDGGNGLTPDDVRQHLEEFERNFWDEVEAARRFAKRYPKAVRERKTEGRA